jgi:hypothetical protein
MKTKILLVAALLGAASLSAQAGVHVGISFGLPLPLPVVVVHPACPPPVVVAAPICPPPVVATAVVATPPCPGPDYAWVPGYWSVNSYGRVWVGGGWRYHGAPIVYRHGYGYGHGYGWDHR